MRPIALARLLQLSSQALPIGGYSHSQGLEAAIEREIVRDESSLLRWIADVLAFSMSSFEIPCLLSMAAAWARSDAAGAAALNDEYLSSRESAEMRAATVQMGFSLRALLCVLPDLAAGSADALCSIREPSLPCVWSAAAAAWQIEPREAVMGYLWAWAENQVLVAAKAVPLGQSAGQRVLLAVGAKLADLAAQSDAGEMGASEIGAGEAGAGAMAGTSSESNFCPGLAILSSQHETQYSRLFRS
ncbi:MAG TPA: urease accessory UreF family protein [Steroidobacteraceae bacterium]|nr:urease accessory UreF family protein [Steroidobacteraceae bacterium]